MREKLHLLTRHRGFLTVLAASLVLYLLPGRYAFPVTGRIASACANIAAFLQPRRSEDEPAAPIERLRRELVRARQELAATQNELHLLQEEIESLTGIKSSSEARFARVIPARVVLRRDASNFRRTILVDRGSRDGVQSGMLVLWGCEQPRESRLAACVVGTVDAVGPHACRILLASDPGFRIPALVLDSRARVVVEGKSPAPYPMRLKHVGTGTLIRPGDVVVTSGSLGMFPPGLLVGIVAEIEGRQFSPETEITLSSPVNLDELESVIIVELAVPAVPQRGGTAPAKGKASEKARKNERVRQD